MLTIYIAGKTIHRKRHSLTTQSKSQKTNSPYPNLFKHPHSPLTAQDNKIRCIERR